jgi:hypothetical protein
MIAVGIAPWIRCCHLLLFLKSMLVLLVLLVWVSGGCSKKHAE